jgi:hypothetical protein
MFSPLRRLWILVSCLLALASPTSMSYAQNVWTRGTKIGNTTKFPVPTIFKGYVYMGTQTEVAVFGLCGNPNPACAH